MGDKLPEVNYPQELKEVRERIKIGDRPTEKTPTPKRTVLPSESRGAQDSPGAQQCRTLENTFKERINKKEKITVGSVLLRALRDCSELND